MSVSFSLIVSLYNWRFCKEVIIDYKFGHYIAVLLDSWKSWNVCQLMQHETIMIGAMQDNEKLPFRLSTNWDQIDNPFPIKIIHTHTKSLSHSPPNSKKIIHIMF